MSRVNDRNPVETDLERNDRLAKERLQKKLKATAAANAATATQQAAQESMANTMENPPSIPSPEPPSGPPEANPAGAVLSKVGGDLYADSTKQGEDLLADNADIEQMQKTREANQTPNQGMIDATLKKYGPKRAF